MKTKTKTKLIPESRCLTCNSPQKCSLLRVILRLRHQARQGRNQHETTRACRCATSLRCMRIRSPRSISMFVTACSAPTHGLTPTLSLACTGSAGNARICS